MQKSPEHGVVMSRRSALGVTAGALASVFCTGCGLLDTLRPDLSPSSQNKPDMPVISDKTGSQADETAQDFVKMLKAGEVGSVMVLGDSITAGYMCDGYGPTTDRLIYAGPYGEFYESSPEVKCWTNEFRSYLAEKGVTNFVNAGICGAKMRWIAESDTAWIREQADVIFVMLGTNDAIYHTMEEFRDYADTALQLVAQNCKLMVVIAPPENDWEQYAKRMSQTEVETLLRGITENHGWNFTSVLNSVTVYTDDFNDDQCHPTTKGSYAIWEYLKAHLGL